MRQNKLPSNEQTRPSINFKYHIILMFNIIIVFIVVANYLNKEYCFKNTKLVEFEIGTIDIGLFVRMSSDYVIPIFSDYVIPIFRPTRSDVFANTIYCKSTLIKVGLPSLVFMRLSHWSI